MGMAMLGGVRINRHPTHRIFDLSRRVFVRDVRSMIAVRVSFVNCHGNPTLSLYTLRG